MRWTCCLALLTLVGSLFANPANRGFSGAPGLNRCASSCHGSGVGTVQVSGFPTEYSPDSTYLVTIQAISGLPIKNFNASVRVGTGTATAGTITAGQGTATYNVSQEPNGVHLSQIDQQSATFNWQAPSAGTGTVRLYAAAHQGNRNQGPNTDITLVADELALATMPGQADGPYPANGQNNVPPSVVLSWNLAQDATDYEVWLGSDDQLVSLGTTPYTYFSIPDLLPSTTYQWRIDSRNDAGTTIGQVWAFTTETGSPIDPHPVPQTFEISAAYPNPFNSSVRIELNVPVSSLITAKIFDRTGRLVATLADGATVTGNAALTWDAGGYSAGLYFLVCNCDGLTLSQKLVYLP